MANHMFKISVGESAFDAKIELDGKELTGVTGLSFNLKPGDLSVVMLEIMGEVRIEGGFKESAIIQVRQPQFD